MIGNNVSYIKAYTEVNCLLKCLPKSYIDRLPNKLIELIQNQSNEKYNINIDINKSLLEHDFSEKTKDLIAVIKYNYWASDEEKQKLKQKFYENENKYQEELLEKYNPNEIFNKIETQNDVSQQKVLEKNVQMVEYKENLFIKILNKIKNLLKRY